MAEPFIGEIRIFSFHFAPKGWAFCDGRLLPVAQNQALFSLLGTTYGGDGSVTFALPALQGRVPISMGNGYIIGELAGQTSHTLISSELPSHNHLVEVANEPVVVGDTPSNTSLLGTAPSGTNIAAPIGAITPMAPQMISAVGDSQAHNNMQSYLALNFCIALQGVFPSQS